MARNLLAALAVLLSLIWHPAAAAESQPGDPCSVDGHFVRSGGPELGGAYHFMICDAGTWQPAISFTSAAKLTQIGNQSCATGELLKFDGAKWACAVDGAAAIPGNHREILFNSGGALATDPGLLFASSGALTAASAALSGGVKIGDVATCDASAVGTIRYSSDSIEYCADNAGSPLWSAMAIGGMPAGAIAAFEDASCPTGWTEYLPARGRFLRGIDNGAGLDPDGTRAPGNVQADALQNITGSFSVYTYQNGNAQQAFELGAVANANVVQTGSSVGYNFDSLSFDASRVARTSTETRPKNVAVIYCQYSGSGGGGGGSTTLAGLTDVDTSGAGDGECLTYSNSTSKWESAACGSADNLGDHTATLDLTMGANDIIFASGYGLQVLGGALLKTGVGGNTFFVQAGDPGAWAFAAATSDGTNRLIVNENGNVGIGTANPESELQIKGGAPSIYVQGNTTAGEKGLRLHVNNNLPPGGGAYIDFVGDTLNLRGTLEGGSGGATIMQLASSTGRVGIGIGTAAPTHILHINGVGRSLSSTWATSSDRRVKENIEPLAEGLDTLMRLRPVSFEYIDSYRDGKDGMDGKMRGFIAQEVEAVVPEMVKTVDEKFGDQEIADFRLLNNADFTPILVKAVQEIKADNDDLRAANDNQSVVIDALRAEFEAYKAAHP